MFEFTPNNLAPTYESLSGWRAVGDMSDNAFGLEPPATQKKAATHPAARKTHLLPLTAGLTYFQKVVMRHLITRQKEEKKIPTRLTQDDVHTLSYPVESSSRLEAWQIGYLTLVANSGLDLAEKMHRLGLTWYHSLAQTINPVINVDEIAIFNERADANPSRQLAAVLATQDPLERSRLGLIFNRWVVQWTRDHPQEPITLEKSARFAPHQNWSYLNLFGQSVPESNLDFADATGIILEAAHISHSSFQETRLRGANLKRANLEASSLRGANLIFATLQSATLSEADCTGADFTGTNLNSVKAYGTIFDRAFIGGVTVGEPLAIKSLKCGPSAVSYVQLTTTFDGIQDTRFRETEISNVSFENCDFAHAEFNETIFENVVFHDCNFPHTLMKNCTFRGKVIFEYCDFDNFAGFDNWNIEGEVIIRVPQNMPVSKLVVLKKAGFTIEIKGKASNHDDVVTF